MELVKYEAACRAVAEAKTIDECKEITNRAEAARAYARQAKNRELEVDAIEIRVRAERRLGEILLTLRQQQQFGQGRGARPITLSHLGVDHNTSGGAQRLAKLSPTTFEQELRDWHDHTVANRAIRLEVPLQRFRKPSIVGDRQRAAAKKRNHTIRHNDPFGQYVAPDGRRVADWRAGELQRQKQLFERVIRCVDALTAAMPIANPDPLDTMEMIFRDADALERILTSVWDEAKVQPGATGVDDVRITKSRIARTRQCEQCGTEFIMRHMSGPGLKGLVKEGRFCSRKCAQQARKSGT